jgi:hypothetical protein
MGKPVPWGIAGFTESKKRPTAERAKRVLGVYRVDGIGYGDFKTLMCAGTSGIREVYATL